ncbi:MarR family transcriptional regulator [Halorussus salinisoli]|uniref:MarR family transcriptional regulator n=1 Tax=Halorussus salinisoli TaxID=2558242 RepID=UPI002A9177B7|nr:helix-turn-helix domain-containing protein [Halorussus salinisoli]
MDASGSTDTSEPYLTREHATDALLNLPPSAKLIVKVLKYNETMTQGQLVEESLLPDRTVRYALNRLDDEGLLHSEFSLTDARKRCYSLDLEYLKSCEYPSILNYSSINLIL